MSRWRRRLVPAALAAVVGAALGLAYAFRPHVRYRQHIRAEGPIPATHGGRTTRGTYVNPVGDQIRLGDPFVLKDGGRYLLYGTRARDGFRYYESSDLVSFVPRGYFYDIEDRPYCTRSFWAPEVHRYRGSYYLVFSCEHRGGLVFADKPKYRLALARSERATGPFVDVRVPWFESGDAIDPHLFIDEDERPYLYFTRVGREGSVVVGRIYGVALSPDLLSLVGEPRLLAEATPGWEIADPKNHTNEGPHVFKRGVDYYLLYSANHFLDPHYATGYARSRSPLGPFAKASNNPVLEARPELGVAGTGHASVTLSPDETEWFIVYHAHDPKAQNNTVRTVNVDRMTFDAAGDLRVNGPTRSEERLPSGAP
jgi:beta-xylosidase